MKADQLIRTIEIKDRNGRVTGTKEVVTYQGLLSKAHDEGLAKVETTLVQIPSDENNRTAIAKAVIETAKGRFEAIGDASPENVNHFIIPHLIRMAETRAKARALRDAVNIGIVSFEELDGEDSLPNGPDLGSGAQPPKLRAVPGSRKVADAGPAKPAAVSGDGASAPMSEAQRRYLFRLLAGQGIQGDAAQEYLTRFLGVASLKEASRATASDAIERLMRGVPEEVSDGHPER